MAAAKSEPEEKKIMDVAEPGSTKPATGSKPMVIGHKSLASDPSIKPQDAPDVAEMDTEAETKEQSPTAKKIRIEPLAGQDGKDTHEETPSEAEKTESSEVTNQADEPKAADVAEDTLSDETPAEESEKDSEESRENNLQDLIKSKEYFVPIQKASGRSAYHIITLVLSIILLGMISYALLVDAEIIESSITLPFNFL